jgi:hypothetical protein
MFQETESEITAIATEAYVYLYPLVLMDVTRRVMTNAEPKPGSQSGPMNMFHHLRAFPPADFRDVVRPNFDTLYSIAWLDLGDGPMIVSVPDTEGRYYLLQMLDMWTDTFAVPGKRTSGTAAADFGLVAPGWPGRLPSGVERIDAPTTYVWIVGRTQANGPKDYDAVHNLQDGFRITPLSRWGKPPKPVKFQIDSTVDMKTPPMKQVEAMPGSDFFEYAAELMKLHPPHITDWSIAARLKRIGIEPGESFEFNEAGPAVQRVLQQVPAAGLDWMNNALPTNGRNVNGWQIMTESVGVYGNDYLKRAMTAMAGLGANQPEDAIYPFTSADAGGKPLDGSAEYLLHFGKLELPPVDAFWSVTLYDVDGFPVPNPIDRHSLGDRDPLKFNADGSLDLYLQQRSPGKDREANWLPTPARQFSLAMRLYAPRPEARDGRWLPPALRSAATASKAA